MADNNDDIVSQFMAFSGCADASQAASYLEMSGGNLETAVGLYMEHQGGGAGASGGGEDAVRAPDATQRMQLMDDHHGGLLHPAAGALPAALRMDPALRMMHEMMENELEAAQRSAFSEHIVPDARAAVNAAAAEQKENEEDDDDEYNYDDDDDDNDEVQVVQEPPRLADMFAPPSYRFTTGGFANAKTTAKDSKRWLLVNVQRDDEFSSHALNRDVWGDELIENLISEGFVFWQVVSFLNLIIILGHGEKPSHTTLFFFFRWIPLQKVEHSLNVTRCKIFRTFQFLILALVVYYGEKKDGLKRNHSLQRVWLNISWTFVPVTPLIGHLKLRDPVVRDPPRNALLKT